MTNKATAFAVSSEAAINAHSARMLFFRDSVLVFYLTLVLTGKLELLEGSIYSQILIICFLCASILFQSAIRTPLQRIIIVSASLYPMIIWIVLSVTWSDFGDISLRRAIRLVMETTAITLVAATYREQYKLLRVIFIAFSMIILADIILLAVPGISFSPIGYVGAHDSKQSTGIFCLVALPIFLMATADRRIFRIRIVPILCTIGCLLILAISRCVYFLRSTAAL